MCSVANQVQACDVHLSCVTCIRYSTCIHQNCMQQCAHRPVFLSFACVKHASTRVYLHACVKFKLSSTVYNTNTCTVIELHIHMLISNLVELCIAFLQLYYR